MRLSVDLVCAGTRYKAPLALDGSLPGREHGWGRFRAGGVSLMGVHAWIERVDKPGESRDPVHLLTLIVNNGTLEPDATARGGLYFEELSVRFGWGLTSFAVRRFGERHATPLIGDCEIIAEGAHFFPGRAHLTRRYLISSGRGISGAVVDRVLYGRATSPQDDLVSGTIGPTSSAYTLTPRTMTTQISILHTTLSYPDPTGAGFDIRQKPFGPWCPWGNVWDAGEVSGANITLNPGFERTRSAGLYHALVGDLVAERMPVATYRSDGTFATRENTYGQGYEYNLYGGGDSGQLEPFMGSKVWNQPNGCTYVQEVSNFQRHDAAHLIRAYGDDLAAAWLCHDAAAEHRLALYAEDMRISHWQGLINKTSDYKPFSLGMQLQNAQASPGHGTSIQRSEAWVDLLGATRIARGPTEPLWLAWGQTKLALYRTAQMPSGLMYEGFYPDSDNGEPWDMFALDHAKQECPSWQAPFLLRGWYALAVQARDAPALASIQKLATALYLSPRPTVAGEDNTGQWGNPRYLVTAIGGVPVAACTEGVGPARPYHDADALALAYRVSGNKAFLDAMLKFGVIQPTLASKQSSLESGDPAYNAEAAAVVKKWIAAGSGAQ